jgi:cyclopropane fatty-acyl-phospholipid synthase-like methyltransferase
MKKDRSASMEYEQTELITRYKENYKMVERFPITYDMIIYHWDLERRLRDELLNSDASSRVEAYARCYSELYKELPWLNDFTNIQPDVPDSVRFTTWVAAIGAPPKKIFEIGAGQGRMLRYLASLGHECTGSDVTVERAAATACQESEALQSVVDNAVSIENVKDGAYDRVLSDQVIEHLHPGDIVRHVESVRRLLRPGGRYIVCCPHIYAGPADVSRVFGCDEAAGLHLKEYKWRELVEVARNAGFDSVFCPTPGRLSAVLKTAGIWSERSEAFVGKLILTLMRVLESLLARIPNPRKRRQFSSVLLRLGLFRQSCFLIAQVSAKKD